MSALALVLAAALAASGGPPEGPAVRRCMRSNLPEQTLRQTVELVAVDAGGGERALRAELRWKRDEEMRPRLHLEVLEPFDLRGAATLVIERPGEPEIFSYVPKLRKVRRLTGAMLSDGLWGTDFAYEDLRLLHTGRWDVEEGPVETVTHRERPAWRLPARPAGDGDSPYERLEALVDAQTCLALVVEFFAEGERRPRKRMEADPAAFERHGERWLAREQVMQDLRDGSRSRLRVLESEYDPTIDDRIFRPSYLQRGR